MSSFWEKTTKRKLSAAGTAIKEGTVKASQATGRGAKRTKLKADIALLERKVRNAKEAFGVKVWSAMDAADAAGTDAIFAEYKNKVDALASQIAAKRDEIDALNAEAEGKPRPTPRRIPLRPTQQRPALFKNASFFLKK